MQKLLFLGSACLAAATASANAQMSAQSPMAPMSAGADMPAMPTDAPTFAMTAGASDQYEIQSSKLALSNAKSPAVKSMARMMITDHMGTTRKMAAAAKASGMTPPVPMLQPMQQRMIDQLTPLSGADFDHAYVMQQVTAHKLALAVHQTYAASGDNPKLRMVAAGAVPIVKRHLASFERMAKM